jgi:hypothetical protein
MSETKSHLECDFLATQKSGSQKVKHVFVDRAAIEISKFFHFLLLPDQTWRWLTQKLFPVPAKGFVVPTTNPKILAA